MITLPLRITGGVDTQTCDYIDRRMKDGLTKKEAIRCLKRYVAREVDNLLRRHELALTAPRSIGR